MPIVKVKPPSHDAIRRSMVRYRKVSVQMWSDEKFRALSPQPPSGQGLWQHLLTGPHTTSIPGLASAGRAQLAERLGWSTKAFDRCWAEIETLGMGKADWPAAVIWLPRAIDHNEPENPNVVKHWTEVLVLIPACPLKGEAITSIGAWLAKHKPDWPKWNPLPNPSSNPLPNPLPNPPRRVRRMVTEIRSSSSKQEQKDLDSDVDVTARPSPADKPGSESAPVVVSGEHPRRGHRASSSQAVHIGSLVNGALPRQPLGRYDEILAHVKATRPEQSQAEQESMALAEFDRQAKGAPR